MVARMGTEAPPGYRVCPVTGLLCHLPSQRLIIANYVMSLISLAIGGTAAVFVGLSRSSLILVKDPGQYYIWLTAHGLNMLIFWILWFEVALLYFVGTILINAPLYGLRLAWAAFGLMLLGQIIMNVLVFSGKASVMFTAYPPMVAHPMFYVGYILFVLGAGLAVIVFFATLYKARTEKRYEGHLPLATWGGAIAGIIAITVVVHGIISLVYVFLYSIGVLKTVNVMFYRWFFWGLGHDAQYVNVVAMVAVWYALLTLASGYVAANFINEKYARLAFVLYPIFVVPGIGHHILVDPGFSVALKQASGSVGSHFLSVPSMLHAFALLGGTEAVMRATGRTGLFGWLARLPWKNPGFSGLILSMILFGLGGIVAQPQTTLQPNLLFHNTLWVPAHFHWTVVGGTTLAFMALSYYVVPLLTLRKLYSLNIARLQIYLAFIGILILGASMAWLGWLGAPRRTLLLENLVRSEWWTPMTVLGIGAVIFIVSGVLYLVNILLTVLAGKKTTNPLELVGGLVEQLEVKEGAIPKKTGSLVIVFIFLGIVLLSLYFASFIRLESLPEIW